MFIKDRRKSDANMHVFLLMSGVFLKVFGLALCGHIGTFRDLGVF